jgi:hypothetical protein
MDSGTGSVNMDYTLDGQQRLVIQCNAAIIAPNIEDNFLDKTDRAC